MIGRRAFQTLNLTTLQRPCFRTRLRLRHQRFGREHTFWGHHSMACPQLTLRWSVDVKLSHFLFVFVVLF